MGALKLFDEKPEIPPSLLKLVKAAVQKRISSVISYANFVARQLQRSGIYCSVHHALEPLSDGYMVVIEMRLVGIDADMVKHHRRNLYTSSFDYKGPTREFRRVERLISEQSEESGEVVAGERGAEDTPTQEGLGGDQEEGGTGEGNNRRAGPPSHREGTNGGEGGLDDER
ncbi:MAG: hypothetical protein QXX83_07180 [Thermofilum sp.]